MNAPRKWHSIRWRIVLIYFLLVFIVMVVVGVFIISQMKDYQMESVRDNFTTIVQENILSMMEYESLEAYREELQADVESWAASLREELLVVDGDFTIIASSNLSFVGRSAVEVLDQEILVRGFSGEIAEKDGVLSSDIPIKTMAFPIERDGEVIGLFCLRADVSDVYDILENSLGIFVRALLIALVLTTVLGVFIARSITVPINDVTKKAERMAQGDFSQDVSVKSNDEIGRLAEMFNLLRGELDLTVSAISNEKNKLETILKYMVDGLLAVDLNGQIIHANQAVRKMLSLSEEDLEGAYYDDIMGRFGSELSFQTIRVGCEMAGGQAVFEAGGSIFAVRYDRFRDDEGRNVGIILLMENITERQKLESMQKDFVANVSHELKTPLTTIKSYTETLLDGGLEDKETTRQFLTVVDEETDRMNRLVRELLQLSRLDHQQERWNKKDMDLIPLVRTAVARMELAAQNKKQHLNCIFSSGGRISAVVDRDRIEQVVLNVVSNAIKYTQEGGRIDVDVMTVGKEARIIVTDNGIGIEEAEIPRVFERFYRVDKARSREMGGTGLGLAIARQIVEEHDGRIEIESKKQKGTRVTISLPRSPSRGIPHIE
ncbi:MAG: ATP-binding protein [Bacillota bacterium]|nr:ATP-binding protein [Bacillota bacterium]